MLLSSLRSLQANIKHKDFTLPFTASDQKRLLWLWFYNLFNKIDYDRLAKVGPDRNCAEWVLKNGGAVRFEVQNELMKDYLELVPDTSDLVKDHLVEIYAENASLNDFGFHHLKNCNHIKKVTFISCKLIGDTGLERLQAFVKNSLKYLEIKSCYGVTDKGILSLTELRNLDNLILCDLKGISDKNKCADTLKQVLSNTRCDLNM